MSLNMLGGFLASLVAYGAVLASGETLSLEMDMMASTKVTMSTRLHMQERRHKMHLKKIMSNMTMNSAFETLKDGSTVSPGLLRFLRQQADGRHELQLNEQQSNLRATQKKAPGYSGVDKAKDMLNAMIEEVNKKYDLEIEKCCEYDDVQSKLIEQARQDISAFNAEAAEARKEVLDAQSHIAVCQVKLPELGDALAAHNLQCKEDIVEMEAQLKIILGDVDVMSTILSMTDCKKSLFLLSCQDECGSFITVSHDQYEDAASELGEDTRQLLSEGLADVVSENQPKMMMNTTPAPPVNQKRNGPCKSPVPSNKRSGKCSISDSPDCPKMQEKFMYIQAGIVDKRDELQAQLAKLEADCEKVKMNLDSQMSYFETVLKDQQTMMASATKKQNSAEEQSRLKSKELKELLFDYDDMTTQCHNNYAAYEGEECGLKKIRGELYKMKGQDNPAFFQDCVVGDWRPSECSASCAGGYMRLDRDIVTKPVGGALCPALIGQKPCNEFKCPIDCKLADWEGWSACTAKCGGGLMERTRKIQVEPEHGGEPCGEDSEADSCNVQSCDKDCVLNDWTAWSDCSKECDSGTSERSKSISEPLAGDGECPDMLSKERAQDKNCNEFMCAKPKGQAMLHCESKVDVILIIDGSGSLGQGGWEASKKAAAMLARAFGGAADPDVMIAVLLYSYNVEIAQHFTTDTEKAATAIEGLTFPRSLTFTTKALNAATSELSLGRADAESVGILITDGKPMSVPKTRKAARLFRKQARLIVMPVTKWAPVEEMSRWASKPTKDNFMPLKSWKALEDPENLDKIISDACPKVA